MFKDTKMVVSQIPYFVGFAHVSLLVQVARAVRRQPDENTLAVLITNGDFVARPDALVVKKMPGKIFLISHADCDVRLDEKFRDPVVGLVLAKESDRLFSHGVSCVSIGGPGRIRTFDQQIMSLLHLDHCATGPS